MTTYQVLEKGGDWYECDKNFNEDPAKQIARLRKQIGRLQSQREATFIALAASVARVQELRAQIEELEGDDE